MEDTTTSSEGYVIGVDNMGFGLHRACYYKFDNRKSETKSRVCCAFCGRPINIAPGSDEYEEGILVEAGDKDLAKDPKDNGKIITREQVLTLYKILNDEDALYESELDALMGYLDGETDAMRVVNLLKDAYVAEFDSLQEAVWDILETATDDLNDEARLELLKSSDKVDYVLYVPESVTAVVYHA